MERAALAGDRRDHDDLVARPQHPAQRLAALLERRGEQPLAVDVEDVEDEVGDRPAGLAVEPVPKGVVVGPAPGVDHDQLAVQDDGPRRDPDREARQLRQAFGEVAPGRVDDPHLAIARALRRPDERRAPGGRPRSARTGDPRNRTAPGAASATSGPRRRGAGAPARAGGSAARPSRARWYPSAGSPAAIDSVPRQVARPPEPVAGGP